MRFYGKLIGAVIGFMLFRHPIGAVIGGLIGHAFDAGWFNPTPAPRSERGPEDQYQILGLSTDASDSEVEQAYRRLMSQYHPDKVAGAAEEIRSLAEKRAQSINTAYESIQRARRAERERE